MRPEGFVEVARTAGRFTVFVGAVDPVQVDPRLALGAAERLRAHPQLVVQPLDERLDFHALLDIEAMNESQHRPSPCRWRGRLVSARPTPAGRSTRSPPAP